MPDFVNNQAKFLNSFNLIENIGAVTLKKLIDSFSCPEQAWHADQKELLAAGLPEKTVWQIAHDRPYLDPDMEMARLTKEGIDVLTIADSAYPASLKQIYAPPALLYIRGRLTPEDNISVAIVGTRKMSAYGQQTTNLLAKGLCQEKITIVSGLAKGIDAVAHQTALAHGGRTIAVLGSAIDQKNIYPPANRALAEKIVGDGALLSEFPLGTLPVAQNFPQRNRIVAGLTLGTVVVEAPERSGALITARYALEQNREVFAVPGPITALNSFGPHQLIKQGAKPVTCATDILEELNLTNI